MPQLPDPFKKLSNTIDDANAGRKPDTTPLFQPPQAGYTKAGKGQKFADRRNDPEFKARLLKAQQDQQKRLQMEAAAKARPK